MTPIYDGLVTEFGDPFKDRRAVMTPAQAKRDRKKIRRDQKGITA